MLSKRVKILEELSYLLQFVNTFLPKRIDNSSEVFYTTSVSKRVKILGRLSIDLIVAAIVQCSSFFCLYNHLTSRSYLSVFIIKRFFYITLIVELHTL